MSSTPIVRAVQKGDSVTITGFGVFEQRRRAARVARNPRTGETVKVKPTSVPAFRPGAQFKAVVSGAQRLPAEGPAVKTRCRRKRGAKKAAVKKCRRRRRGPQGREEGRGQEGGAKKAVASKARSRRPWSRRPPRRRGPQGREEGRGKKAAKGPLLRRLPLERLSSRRRHQEGAGQEGRGPPRPPVGANHIKTQIRRGAGSIETTPRRICVLGQHVGGQRTADVIGCY